MKQLQKLRFTHITGVVVLAVIALIVFRYLNPNVRFTYFEPSYLPQGITIKQKRIVVRDNRAPESINLNFRTEDWVYSIGEYERIGSIGTAAQDFDPTSTTPTCDIRTSPQHMQYRVCHWIDYDRIGVYEVKFMKLDTYIWSHIPTTRDQVISLSEVDKYVDSFQQKSTIGLPVLRVQGFGVLSLHGKN